MKTIYFRISLCKWKNKETRQDGLRRMANLMAIMMEMIKQRCSICDLDVPGFLSKWATGSPCCHAREHLPSQLKLVDLVNLACEIYLKAPESLFLFHNWSKHHERWTTLKFTFCLVSLSYSPARTLAVCLPLSRIWNPPDAQNTQCFKSRKTKRIMQYPTPWH